MATTSIGFRWLDILEKDFDKACVELDTSLLDAEPEEPEVVCAARQKISTLSSCFSQLTHKALTIFQHSAKLEAELVDMRAELVQTRAALAKATESQLSSDFSGISEALRTRAEAAQFAKENAVLRETVLALHSELFGARLATKYLDKELAGRIQQLQLLGRNMRADIRDSLWAQVEAEILLQRHKSLVRVCRGTAPPPRARPVPSAPRSVTVRRAQQLGLGISVTGGREHGVPILISELEADGPAALTGELYVGDAILAINELDLTQACHKDAVKALQSVKGDCALCVQFIATDDDEKLSEDNYRFPLYPSEDEAGSRALDGGGATPTAPRTPDYTRRRRPSDEDSVTDYDLHYADYNALNNNLNIVEMDDHRIEVETDLQTIPSKPYDDVRHVTNNAYDNRPIIDHSWHDELQRYAADHSRALSEAQRAVIEPQRSVIEPQRSGMELQRSVIEPQRSVLEPQRSVIEPQRSGMELQRSFIEPQRSGMEPQRSVIEPQRSVTEPQRSFIEPQRPVLEQQQPAAEPQRRYIEPQRATEAQRSYLDLQRSVIEYQRHIINQQRPIIDQQRHIMEQQRPVLEQQNSLTDTQRNITETQNSDMEPQRLVKDKKYPSVDTERSVVEQVRYYKDTSRSLLEPRVLNTPYAPIYRYQSSSASPPSTPVHEPRNIKKKKVKSHDWRSKGAYRAIEDDSSDETPKSPQKPVNGGHSVLPATDETAQTKPIETLIDAPNEPLISLQTEAPRPIPTLPPPNEVNPSINRNKIVLPNNPIQAKLVKNKGFRIGSAKRISEPPLTNGNSNSNGSNGVKENYPNQIVTGDGDPDFGTPV